MRNTNIKDLDHRVAIQVNKILTNCNTYDFNIFELNNLVGKKTLMLVAYEVLERYVLLEDIPNDRVFRNFITTISEGYDKNIVYHNDIHAADVVQTCFVICEKGNLVNVIYFNIRN
jgi:hypothetical protein